MPEATRSGWRRFFGLPSTWVGWTSFGLFVAFFAFAIFGQRLGIDTRPLNLASLSGSLITGLLALVFMRDRSWLVWIPVLFALLVVGAEIVQGLLGGG